MFFSGTGSCGLSLIKGH